MFDDRIKETLMDEMMSTFGADVRTDEGSLAYNACAKIAEKLEEVYGDMDALNDNLLPDTQDIAHLILYGRDRGIEYRYASSPVVKGVFQQEIEIGERFSCNDYLYEVTERIENFSYKMVCDTAGTSANANMGELDPVDYIEDYQGGEIIEILVSGVDDEDEEAFRSKVINTFGTVAFGGNREEYRRHIDAMNGVGGCKPIRRSSDSEWINIYVISSAYDVPSEGLIGEIQTAVDPEENAGEGDGLAPIGHKVKVYAASACELQISVNIDFEAGYSEQVCREQIMGAVNEYLFSLRQGWEQAGNNGTVVRISQIEFKILSIEGVVDVRDTTINGEAENLVLTFSEIPILGGVSIHV